MTTGDEKKTACVTGASGNVGSMLVKFLLEGGYVVHATVRDTSAAEKIAHLVRLQSLGELKLFRADLQEEASFDEAVTGCDYVFHVAAPTNLTAQDPENDLIKPAVEGTLNVLRSCLKVKNLRRVIVTSSCAAVTADPKLTGLVDEESWTDVEFLTTEKPPIWGYLLAKTLAEKEALKFAAENKLNLVTLNPAVIVGRSLTPEPPSSVRLSLALLSGEKRAMAGMKTMQRMSGSLSFVHLVDLCRAYIFVAEDGAASGRYILCSVNTGMAELAVFLRDAYPQYQNPPVDLADVLEKARVVLSSEKLVRAGFRFQYNTLEEIYAELTEYGEETGLLLKTKGVSDMVS